MNGNNNGLTLLGTLFGASNFESNAKQQEVQQEMLYLLYSIYFKVEDIEKRIGKLENKNKSKEE